jgi:hypothetical protein
VSSATTVTITAPSAVAIISAVKTQYNGSDLSCATSTDGQITVTAGGGTGTKEYSNDNGANYQPSNVFSGLAAGSYDIVARDANLCVSAATTVTVIAPAPVEVSATPTVLCGASTGSVLVSATGGAGSYTYSSDGITYVPTATFTGVDEGTHTFYAMDANGCIASASATVTLLPLPVPSIDGLISICVGTSNVVYSTEPGMTNYSWLVSGGGIITAGGDITDNTVTVTWNTAGPQTVSVNYTNGNGCSAASATVLDVAVLPAPVPVISGPASICILGNGVYTTEAGMTDYAWTVTGGTFTDGSTNTINVSWTSSGLQAVSVSYKNANGCTASVPSVKQVMVNALPSVEAGTYGPVCIDAADIVLQGTPAGGVWSGTGVTGNSFDPSVGTQTLTYTYTDENTCVNSDQVTITVNPFPVIDPGTYGPACIDGADITLAGIPSGGVWSGNGVTGNSFDPSAGTQSLTYTYTNEFFCTNSAITTIIVYPVVPASVTIAAWINSCATTATIISRTTRYCK